MVRRPARKRGVDIRSLEAVFKQMGNETPHFGEKLLQINYR